MPLVTLNEVKPIIAPSVASALGVSGVFEATEAEAAKLVRDETGLVIPGDADDAPDWVVTPMAWLLQKLMLSRITNASPEFILSINKDYDRAIELLAKHRVAVPVNPGERAGEIEGMHRW